VIPGRRRKAAEEAAPAPKAGKGKAAEGSAPEPPAAAAEAEPEEAAVGAAEAVEPGDTPEPSAPEEKPEEKAARYENLGREAAQGQETLEERVAPYVADKPEAEGEAAADEEEEGKS
jgi:hypothetical protein